MSESEKPPRGAGGRWLKGHRYPSTEWKEGDGRQRGDHGSLALQRQLEGNRGHQVLQKLFRGKSTAIMHAIKRVILDPATPPSVKVAAAQLFLDRGWGKMESEAAVKKNVKKAERPIVVVSHVPRKNDGA